PPISEDGRVIRCQTPNAGVGVRLPGVRLLQDAGTERTPAGGAAAVLVPVLDSARVPDRVGGLRRVGAPVVRRGEAGARRLPLAPKDN
ncbi:hypothetical protein ACJX0J_013978, partial [Zea mays]